MRVMYTVKHLPSFMDWLNSLPDRTTRLRLAKRLDKAARGILGDVKPVGGGIYEMREHFGAGYRMYSNPPKVLHHIVSPCSHVSPSALLFV